MANNTTPSSASGPPRKQARSRSRVATGRNASNTLRPSPALVSWIGRAVSKLTAEAPWTYSDEVSVARRASAPPIETDARGRSASQEAAVPDDVRERFVRVGRDYYFSSGTKAFRDHGQKVVTNTENTEVIRSLVRIAVVRGWQDITVTGTKRFRRDAWRIATVNGLIVRGYRPSDFEKQKFVRDLAAAREPLKQREPLIDPPAHPQSAQARRGRNHESGLASATSKASDTSASPDHAGLRQQMRDADPRRSGDRRYSGTLLEHGSAPYEFHPHGESSYFVRIQTPRGPKVLWGKDFERALHDAKANVGDEIQARQAGRETVTVRRKQRDEEGRVVNERNLKTHRNQWEIRRDVPAQTDQQRQDVRSVLPSEDGPLAAREKPEIQAALRVLKGAQLFAEQRISDLQQRSAFVNAVRAELVQLLDRDAGVAAPRLRPRSEPAAVPSRTLS
jgi:hypothetical protein